MKVEIKTEYNKDEDNFEVHSSSLGIDKVEMAELSLVITELEIQRMNLLAYYHNKFEGKSTNHIKIT